MSKKVDLILRAEHSAQQMSVIFSHHTTWWVLTKGAPWVVTHKHANGQSQLTRWRCHFAFIHDAYEACEIVRHANHEHHDGFIWIIWVDDGELWYMPMMLNN